MQNPRYALVAYIEGPLGEFVENLRRELHPDFQQFAAHVTLLPPRRLQGTEASALQTMEKICSQAEPFEIGLGNVETFIPATPTVYIRVAHASGRMCELHQQLNIEALACREEWPYVPHMTIVKMAGEQSAQSACNIATERWTDFAGSRSVRLERLTFVREDEPNFWVDLAPVFLGGRLVAR